MSTMDAETLELLLAQVGSLWHRPLSEFETAQWTRELRPFAGPALDPELASVTLTMMRHHPRWTLCRPAVEVFRAQYDRAYEASLPPAPDPAERTTPIAEAIGHLDEIRALLVKARDIQLANEAQFETGRLL